MNVAIYARISTGRQVEEGVSIEGQVDQVTKWTNAEGHSIIEIYKELGCSATDDRRPEFKRMISDAKSPDHPFDIIAVHTLSRFFRSTIDLGIYERELKRVKVQLISITQLTAEDESGAMLRTLISAFDEYQSKENGKNVRRSMKENAKQGYFNRSKAPFGYTAVQTDIKGRNGYKRKLEPNHKEADVVRLIFSLATGDEVNPSLGVKSIATELNKRGFQYRGKTWKSQKIWEILDSSTYYGDYFFNKRNARTRELRDEADWVLTKVPPVITREIFDKARELRSERAPGKSTEYRSQSSRTLLTGIAKCGICGKGFVLMSGKGGKYDYYRCSTRQYHSNHLCTAPNIPREELEAVVLNKVAELVLTPERIQLMLIQLREDIKKLQAPDRQREKTIQRQLSLTKEQVDAWYELIEQGKLELHQTLKDRLAASQHRIDAMARELADIGRRRQIPLKKFGTQQIQEFAEAMRDEILTPGSKYAKKYLHTIVSEIRINPPNGVITGANANMAGAISGWKRGRGHLMVPSHVSNWRARKDSNLRPPSS
ncbi:MAG: recombinase family protein [Candidatus Thiodiazotropha sp.]